MSSTQIILSTSIQPTCQEIPLFNLLLTIYLISVSPMNILCVHTVKTVLDLEFVSVFLTNKFFW